MRYIILTLYVLVIFNCFSQENTTRNFLDLKVKKIMKSPTDASEYLGIRIFPSTLFADSVKSDLIYNLTFSETISVATVDMEEGLKSINQNDFEHWGITNDSLINLCVVGTFQRVKSLEFTPIEVSGKVKLFLAYDELNYYTNSIIYYPELLKKYDSSNMGIVIGIPVRHVCSVMPIYSIETFYNDLSFFYNFNSQIYINENNPTTMEMFLYKNGQIYTISAIFDSNNNFVKFLVPIELTEK